MKNVAPIEGEESQDVIKTTYARSLDEDELIIIIMLQNIISKHKLMS